MGATFYTFEWAERLWTEQAAKPITTSDLRMMLRVYRAVAIQRGKALSDLAFELNEASDRAQNACNNAIENSPEVVLRNGEVLIRKTRDANEEPDV